MSIEAQRRLDILTVLKSGPITAYALALYLNAPQASVRRTIRTLRRHGHLINDARDNNGLYRLVQA